MLGDDAAEAATMLVRHSRDVYGNGEDWDPASGGFRHGMFSWSVQCIKIDNSPGRGGPAQPLRITSHRTIKDPSANCHSSIVYEDHFERYSMNWNIINHRPVRSISIDDPFGEEMLT